MTVTMIEPNLMIDAEATMEQDTMSVAEVADRLGVTPRTVVRWIKGGEAFPNAYQSNPFLKTSPFVIPISDVERFEKIRRGEVEV